MAPPFARPLSIARGLLVGFLGLGNVTMMETETGMADNMSRRIAKEAPAREQAAPSAGWHRKVASGDTSRALDIALCYRPTGSVSPHPDALRQQTCPRGPPRTDHLLPSTTER